MILTVMTGCKAGFQVVEHENVGPPLPTSRAFPHTASLPSLDQARKNSSREASCPGSLEHSGKSKEHLGNITALTTAHTLLAAGTEDQPFCSKAGSSSIRTHRAYGKLLQELQFCRAELIRQDRPASKTHLHYTFYIRFRAWHTPVLVFILFKGLALQTLNFTCVSRVPLKHNGAAHANNVRACRAVALFHYSICRRPGLRGYCCALSVIATHLCQLKYL